MPFVPVMWSVWGLTIVIMLPCFFIAPALPGMKKTSSFSTIPSAMNMTAQQAIVAKVNKVQPLIRVSEIVAAVATLFVIGYYVNDIFNQFK